MGVTSAVLLSPGGEAFDHDCQFGSGGNPSKIHEPYDSLARHRVRGGDKRRLDRLTGRTVTGRARYPVAGDVKRKVIMNVLPLVTQLRFARSEFVRSMDGVSDDDAQRHVGSLNCLSWMVGHLANQENWYWVLMGQRRSLFGELNDLVGFRKPQTTPSLPEMWSTWKAVTDTADVFLNSFQAEMLTAHLELRGKPAPESIGTLLMRNIFHYWFHIGQVVIVRKMLGHTSLPEFVGDLSSVAY